MAARFRDGAARPGHKAAEHAEQCAAWSMEYGCMSTRDEVLATASVLHCGPAGMLLVLSDLKSDCFQHLPHLLPAEVPMGVRCQGVRAVIIFVS